MRLQAQHINVHVELDRLTRPARLLVTGRTKVEGIHLEKAVDELLH